MLAIFTRVWERVKGKQAMESKLNKVTVAIEELNEQQRM